MKRKTIEVAKVLEFVNDLLKNSDADHVGRRKGAMAVLEMVLHNTGNYNGFNYLLEGQCDGLPGVNYVDGVPDPDYEARFKHTDSTRVRYYD